jgi:hypothetical protein
MAGIAGLSKGAADGLQKSLASQSAPANPQTPTDPSARQPFNELFYLAMRKIPRIIEQAMEHAPEGDLRQPVLNALLKGTFPILKEGPQLADQIDDILRALFPLSSPSLKKELQSMFAPPPISPPTAPGGGAPGPGLIPGQNQGPAGGAMGQSPAGGPPGAPGGDAGVAPSLPA